MISNADRRKAARRLRDDAERGALPYSDFLGAVAYDVDVEKEHAAVLHRLADLIEPSCDRQALLELADSLDRLFMTNNDGYIRCKLCPAHGLHDICYDLPVSCHDRAIVATARRIREALGVES